MAFDGLYAALAFVAMNPIQPTTAIRVMTANISCVFIISTPFSLVLSALYPQVFSSSPDGA
jgi:hypothetical protein